MSMAAVLRWLRRFNWVSFFAMLALITVGALAVKSAGGSRSELVFHGVWLTNLKTAIFGLFIYFTIAFLDYRRLIDIGALPAYVVSLLMLILVLIVGDTVFGGKRWLWFFQPSEIAKLGVLAAIAGIFGDATSRWRGFQGFLLASILTGVPALLILLEPDLGTTLTLLPAVFVMLVVARVWRAGLVTLAVSGVLVAVTILGAVYEAEKPGADPERREAIMKRLPLEPHQVKRVRVFLFPEDDPTGAGYNLRQSMIAIGSGGMRGRGLGHGETHALKYLPPAISMNDFIFCVWAEETGFVGALLLLFLYLVLLLSACWTALNARDGCGRLLALGVATLVFAHVFVNVAMSLGMVPITGLPLPFVSSGRTFLLVLLVGFGFVQSVAVHSYDD